MTAYKDIEGFPGYRVGDDGSVWSRWHYRRLTDEWRQLRGYQQRYGHTIFQIGKSQLYAHRLVLQAFVGPCPVGMSCRHLNGNATDNRLENLVWGTHRENMEDMIAHETTLWGEKSPRAKLKAAQVLDIVKRSRAGEASVTLAVEYGVTVYAINAINEGRSWSKVTGISIPASTKLSRQNWDAERRRRRVTSQQKES